MGTGTRPFSLKAAKSGKSVIARNGSEVRIICFDMKSSSPIVALLKNQKGREEVVYYSNAGTVYSLGMEHDYDLFMKPIK